MTVDSNSQPKRTVFISLNVKLLLTFTLLFTLIFAGVFKWFYDFASARALERLSDDLSVLVNGAVSGINGDEFQQMYQETEPNDEGVSDDPRFWAEVDWLATIRQIDPRSNAYTLIQSDVPDEYIFVTNAALRIDPENSARYGDTLTVPAEDFPAFPELFNGTRDSWMLLEPYEDSWGAWISGYRAIHNSAGEVVGVLGTDFRAEYLRQVQQQVENAALPAFGITYVIVFVTVYMISRVLTRPIKRLRAIAMHIGEGDYNVDLSVMTKALIQDEINKFAQVFEIMVSKVRVREETLKRKVEELRIEIDSVKQQAHVSEIVDTDFFRELQTKARQVRQRKSGTLTDTEESAKSETASTESIEEGAGDTRS